MQVRVLTYNIRHGLGTDRRQDLSRILPVLIESRADIICLQEVDLSLPRSGFADQAAWLAGEMGFSQAMAVNFGVRGVAGMGNAILSRWGIYPAEAKRLRALAKLDYSAEAKRLRALAKLDYSTWNKTLPFRGERRGLLMAEVGAPAGDRVAVFCTHWGLDEAQRLRQAGATAELVSKTTLPYLLCGDLNARPGERSIASLMQKAGLQDAGPAGALTYPADRPEAKIDYVLFSRHWTLVNAGVIDTLASDHRPLFADISL